MPDRSLVDTNIVVYAYDPTDGGKQAKAQALIQGLVQTDSLILSVQVLNEFYRAATRLNRPPSLSHTDASERVRHLASAAREVLPITAETVLQAIEAIGLYGLPLWDAVLWATAQIHGVTTIFTEDLPSSSAIGGVQYVDPFAPTVGQ